MAITKIIGAIHPPKSGGRYKVLNNTINYILNPEKTAGGLYTGALNCFTDSALADMVRTKEYYGKTSSKKSERLGYHIAISFSPEEKVSPETALSVVGEFAKKYLGNEYEAVYGVHTDCGHMHGHICFNSVNLRTGYKYRYEDGDWAKDIQPIVDEICQKYGLHTLFMDTGVTNEEYEEEQKERKKQRYYKRREQSEGQKSGKSNNKYHNDAKESFAWNDYLREAIDDLVLRSNSFSEFEALLKSEGFQIRYGNSERYGKHMKLKAPGMGIFRKTYQLGQEYTLSRLEERIAIKAKPVPKYVIPEGSVLVIPVRYFVRAKRNPLSAPMKRYYAKLYRLGIKPHYARKRLSYQDVKKATLSADKMERQMNLVLKHGIGTVEIANQTVKLYKDKFDEIKSEQKAVEEAHAPYKKVVWLYRKKKRLEQKLDKVQSEEREKLQDQVETLSVRISKYGLSEEQLQGYTENYSAKMKELRQRLREAEEEVEAAEEVRKEFQQEAGEYTEEMETFYNSIPEEEKEQKKGRSR